MKTSKTIIVRSLTTLAASLLVAIAPLCAADRSEVRVALLPGAGSGTQQQAATPYDYSTPSYNVNPAYNVAPQYQSFPQYNTTPQYNVNTQYTPAPAWGLGAGYGLQQPGAPAGCANGQCSPYGYGQQGSPQSMPVQPYLNQNQGQAQYQYQPQQQNQVQRFTPQGGLSSDARLRDRWNTQPGFAPGMGSPYGTELTNLPVNSGTNFAPNWNWNATPVQPAGYSQPNIYQPTQYQNIPVQPSVPQVNEVESIGTKLTMRYQNPNMLDFLSRTNFNQTMTLYSEASRLIDSRHVSPPSYEVRTRQAVNNLILALENPAFLQASGVSPNPQLIASTQQELYGLLQSQAPRTANESIGLMQWAADLANQRLGIRKEAIALEYLNASLDSLDKYSAFVPTRSGSSAMLDVELMQTAGLEENIVGVGVELKADERGALVMGTIPNGPAAQARLMKGDVLVGIDGKNLAGLSLSQVADMISGPMGSTVTFRVLRDNQQYTASLRRQKVYVSSVADAQMLSAEVGYARVKQFSESTAEDLEKALMPMFQKGMKSIVLDLRGNPGGLLTEAIQLSDMFVPAGRIVATKGRNAEDNTDERAKWEKTWSQPLVVLVDENSASASEIFAAAIQENQRGVIVGRTTYGKGTVQTHFPLSSVSGNLKLTTAKFYSPAGREMAGSGVTPDVNVPAAALGTTFATLDRDTDVQAAMNTLAQGTPATLAQQAARNQPRYDLSRLGN
ncbi:MAG: S41 family peptidase [Planctomycetaceae bacterium]